MKNIMKILFGTILSFSVVNFAQAGEMTVTGSAEATYVISSSDSTTAKSSKPKALGIANELAFNADGEFANGFTWKYQIELDPNTSGQALNDDTRLELTTPYGTVGLYNSEGDLNTHLKYSASAYAPGHDFGNNGKFQGGTGMNSYNNIQYHTPADLLPFGTSVKLAYSSGGEATQSNDAANTGTQNLDTTGVVSYQITSAPVDGLSVGASYLNKKDSGSATTVAKKAQDYETGGAFAKYSIANFTFGVGRHFVAPNTNLRPTGTLALTARAVSAAGVVSGNVQYFENDTMSVGYAINDNLSVSYDRLRSTAEVRDITAAVVATTKANRDLEVDSIQAAYDIGGAVLSLGQKSIDNIGYGEGINEKEYLIGLKMAF